MSSLTQYPSLHDHLLMRIETTLPSLFLIGSGICPKSEKKIIEKNHRYANTSLVKSINLSTNFQRHDITNTC